MSDNHPGARYTKSFNEKRTGYKSMCNKQYDHTFMQTVASRIIELTPKGIFDGLMTSDEYSVDERVKALKEEMYK